MDANAELTATVERMVELLARIAGAFERIRCRASGR
jgi:hypothetical protein